MNTSERRDGIIDAAALASSAAFPAWFAAAHAACVADAAHDLGVVRAVGLGWTGALRALDAPLAGVFMWLPIGTRVLRAGLASALACGAAGALLYVVAKKLYATACAGSPRLGAMVAAIASLTATLAPAWQVESASPGGSALAALLVFAPMACLLDDAGRVRIARLPVASLAIGLAVSYEPLVGMSAAAACAALLYYMRPRDALAAAPLPSADQVPPLGRLRGRSAAGFAIGLLPFAFALVGRASSGALTLSVPPFAEWAGESGAGRAPSLVRYLPTELGVTTAILAAMGLVLAVRTPRARPLAMGLVAFIALGTAAAVFGAPIGPSRYAGPGLAALSAVALFAGVTMVAGVHAVAQARIPFAAASASMIVLLELTFPVLAADESARRCEGAARGVARTWDEAAWGALPPGAILLVDDRRVHARLLASRAAGELRGDLRMIPLFDVTGSSAGRELAREPLLAPLWRDLLLASAPEEWSLSSIAAARPLALPFEPAWERPLARHFVPSGLVAVFEPEPRGVSDRARALDAFASQRGALIAALTSAPDPELTALTARLLRARALSLVSSGERDPAVRTLADLRLFAPNDPVAVELDRRLAAAHGPVDVHDLVIQRAP